MYVVYINLLYFCRFFCLLTIKIFFPQNVSEKLVANINDDLRYFLEEQKMLKKIY